MKVEVFEIKRVAILGLGTVGSGFYDILKRKSKEHDLGVEIVKILVKDPEEFEDSELRAKLTNSIDDILDEQIDIVVEVMGGTNPTYDFVYKFIERGVDVVTANKDLIAAHGPDLFDLAKKSGSRVLFEASVGGGIPVIKAIRESLAGNRIHKVAGIINGTSNYILTKMSEGLDFNKALRIAQNKGFAEANPESDVKGYDPARKLAILINIAFGINIEWQEIPTIGVDTIYPLDMTIAESLDCKIKVIAQAITKGDKVHAFVKPVLVPRCNYLSSVENEYNGVMVYGDAVEDITLIGKGAGKMATGSAVYSDYNDLLLSRGASNDFVTNNAVKLDKLWPEASDWILRLKNDETLKHSVLNKFSEGGFRFICIYESNQALAFKIENAYEKDLVNLSNTADIKIIQILGGDQDE